MRARGFLAAALIAASALFPLTAAAQVGREADPGTFTTTERSRAGLP